MSRVGAGMTPSVARCVLAMTSVVSLALGCGGGGGAGVDAPGLDAPCAAAEPVRDVPYQALPGVAPALQALDLYPPCASGAAPVVIWVHGGAWAVGDKANGMTDKIALFNQAGYLLVSVNYRLSPDDDRLEPGRVRHPDHVEDVAAAIAWVADHAASYGGDPSRLAILGHSAGAHLVALVATDGQYLAAHGRSPALLRAVGSFDTEAYDIPRTMATAAPRQATILENAFGDDPGVWRQASPHHQLVDGRPAPPFLLVRRGDAERAATEQAFHDRLLAVGGDSTIIDASSLTHEEVNDHIGAPGDAVMTAPILTFLAAHLE
jgi:arylformamidase